MNTVHEDRTQYPPIGNSIEPMGGATRGTLGRFIALGEGEVGFVTCGHVFGSLNEPDKLVGMNVCATGTEASDR